MPESAPIPMFEYTMRFTRFEVPVTFRLPPRTEEAFRVVIFVVDRLEVPVTLSVDAKRL